MTSHYSSISMFLSIPITDKVRIEKRHRSPDSSVTKRKVSKNDRHSYSKSNPNRFSNLKIIFNKVNRDRKKHVFPTHPDKMTELRNWHIIYECSLLKCACIARVIPPEEIPSVVNVGLPFSFTVLILLPFALCSTCTVRPSDLT